MVSKKSAKSENVLRIRVLAYEPRILDNSVKQIIETAIRLGAKVVGPIPMPTKIKKVTLNRSTFVYKDAREQFEMRTHARIIDIEKPSRQIVDALSSVSLPAGVSVEAQMVA